MYRNFLLEECFPYKILGHKILSDGTELFGNDTQIAPQAWLHQVYPPLNNEEIILLEQLTGVKTPISLLDFYHEMNGFSIFCRKFSISGLRKNFSRDLESAWQPFSIETKNNKERPVHAKKEDIFIGFYSENGNLVCMDSKTEKISICTSNNPNSIKVWKNLYSFFRDECKLFFSRYALKYFPQSGARL